MSDTIGLFPEHLRGTNVPKKPTKSELLLEELEGFRRAPEGSKDLSQEMMDEAIRASDNISKGRSYDEVCLTQMLEDEENN